MGEKIKRVLLVQPNLQWCEWHDFKTSWEVIPYNLCLLAAMIEQDYEVSIIDANLNELSENDFSLELSRRSPDIVGLTMMTSEYAEAVHRAAAVAKKVLPEVPVVLGGIYATTSFDTAMNDTNIDYIVVGEGEHIFPKLLKYLDGSGPFPLTDIGFRENGKPTFLPRAGFINNLDSLPLPAYHLIDYHRYTNMVQRVSVDGPDQLPFARIRTSRGCPVGCSFCQVEQLVGKKFRTRSVENVIEELKWQKEKYGIRSVLFNDDNLILNRKRAKKLFSAMIKERLNLSWNATAVAVFALDEELIEIMAESGCKYMDIAVESGNERILKNIIQKPVNLEHAKNMAKKIKESGIFVAANFIIGFPDETWEEIRNTLRYAEEIDVDYVKIFIATPLKGTRMYDMYRKMGMAEDNEDIEQNMNWSASKIKSSEFSSKDLSILRAYEWDRINFSNPVKRKRTAKRMGITEEELKKLRRKTLDNIKL